MINLRSLRNYPNLASQVKTAQRFFSKSEFPLNAASISTTNLIAVSPHLKSWLKGNEGGFAYSYKHLLQCIEKQDLPSLMKTCDYKLYEKFQSSIEGLNAQNKKMKIVNESSQVKIDFFNESLEIKSYQSLGRGFISKIINWTLRNSVYIPQENISYQENSDIDKIQFSVDVLIQTSMKIKICDDDVHDHEKDDLKDEKHLIRFQIQEVFPTDSIKKAMSETLNFLVRGKGFKKCEWTIQDVDRSLKDLELV